MSTNTTVRRWVVPTAIGAVVGGVALAVVAIWRDQPTGQLTLLGVGVGGLVGALLGVLGRTDDPGRSAAAAGDPYLAGLDRDGRRAFRRAAFRGPVPADPERRAAAIRLIRRTLDDESSGRLTHLVIMGWWVVFGLINVIDRDLWSLPLLVGAAGFLVWSLRRPGQLRRRLTELRGHPDPAGAHPPQSG